MLFFGELDIIVAGGKYEYVSCLKIFFITMFLHGDSVWTHY